MSRTLSSVGLALVVPLLVAPSAHAIAPAYLSDRELASFPILVVARWEKAPFAAHHDIQGNVARHIENFTQLHVLRVIKGDLAPGQHKLMVGMGIAWQEDGTGLSTGTSTELPGDVQDVTASALWFLERQRSWDKADQTEYLSTENYRTVQPLVLADYFAAIAQQQPEAPLAKLLASPEPLVVRRALRFACGEVLPWPNDADWQRDLFGPAESGRVFRELTADVLKVAERKELVATRPLAVSIYAQLAGAECVTAVRQFLTDDDANVRLMAVGVLARRQDRESTAAFARAVQGQLDTWVACAVIEVLRAWGDASLVPALIQFLENDDCAYQEGDDFYISALKARTALRQITRCTFPLNVDAAGAAWSKVEHIADADERAGALAALLSVDDQPLRAEVIGDKRRAFLRVINQSPRAIEIARSYSQISQDYPGGTAAYGFPSEAETRDDFVTLQPGQALLYGCRLPKGFLLADPGSREMKVAYLSNGKRFGLRAWIGTIDVRFGDAWHEVRQQQSVEETWPNGNLKAVGQTINRHRVSEWRFFSEAGDLIRSVNYTTGQEAAFNPQHPEARGAGIRAKQPTNDGP